jgi:hypothetical protein
MAADAKRPAEHSLRGSFTFAAGRWAKCLLRRQRQAPGRLLDQMCHFLAGACFPRLRVTCCALPQGFSEEPNQQCL